MTGGMPLEFKQEDCLVQTCDYIFVMKETLLLMVEVFLTARNLKSNLSYWNHIRYVKYDTFAAKLM